MRPILHIQLPPQISKHLHLRSHLGSADLPERIKYLSQAVRAEATNVQGIADLGTVGAKCLFGSAVFILAAAQRDRLSGRLAYPVHAQVAITCVALHDLTDYLRCASHPGPMINERSAELETASCPGHPLFRSNSRKIHHSPLPALSSTPFEHFAEDETIKKRDQLSTAGVN